MTNRVQHKVIPLFPLNVVLFPGGALQLRIFEPRYIEMITQCLSEDSGFGICLSTSSSGADGSSRNHNRSRSAEEPAEFRSTGTFVKIVDWDRLEDGLLGVTVRGVKRFKVLSTSVRPSQLVEGKVVCLQEVQEGMTGDYQSFSELLQEISSRFDLSFDVVPDRFNEAIWVSGRLAELLPFELGAKQSMLEMDNPLQRFDYMQVLLESLDTDDTPVLH